MENPVMEQKPKKTGAIIGTIVAVLLCGCPGLVLCVLGAYSAFFGMPYTSTINGYSSQGTLPAWYGYVGLCVSVIFIVIPIVVGITTLRTKKPKAPKEPKDAAVPPQTPLPPAS